MRVYFVRHTTPHIEKGICYGQTDVDIDKHKFEEEFLRLRNYLPDSMEAVFSSPLQRCRKLAEQFSDKLALEEDLMELNFGSWELKNWEDIPSEEMNRWMQDYVRNSVPQGESYEQLYQRTLQFIEKIQNLSYQNVAVFTHAGVLRCLLAWVLGMPLEKAFQLHLNYGCCVCVDLDRNYPKIMEIQNFIHT
jgi:alpha-ribazole phosphatase